MNLLIVQPKPEQGLDRLADALEAHPDADAVLFPDGYLNGNLASARALAVRYGTVLLGVIGGEYA